MPLSIIFKLKGIKKISGLSRPFTVKYYDITIRRWSMEEIIRAVSEHPLIATAIIFTVLLILYFIFKSIVKLILIAVLVAVAISGYSYFKHPENRPASFKDAVQKVRAGTDRAIERGRVVYERGRGLFEKGKVVLDGGIEKGKTVLEKGTDKGKDIVDKGKDVAGDIGKAVKGEGKAARKE